MVDEEVLEYVGDADDNKARAPEPFNHIVASPAYNPIWGRGWLGYTVVRDTIDLWFVHGDLSGAVLLNYTALHSFNDKQRSQLWIILRAASSYEPSRKTFQERHSFLVFLLNPQDEVLFPIPKTLRRFMDG